MACRAYYVLYPICPNMGQIKSKSQNFATKKNHFLSGNLSVIESSQPLNNPLVSMKIAYDARFLRYLNLGLLNGWRHLWIEPFFLFEAPRFGHMDWLAELIMYWTPSVQICDGSNPNLKILLPKKLFLK